MPETCVLHGFAGIFVFLQVLQRLQADAALWLWHTLLFVTVCVLLGARSVTANFLPLPFRAGVCAY
jgi:hypothetical protein